jgi:hypothetical protein
LLSRSHRAAVHCHVTSTSSHISGLTFTLQIATVTTAATNIVLSSQIMGAIYWMELAAVMLDDGGIGLVIHCNSTL